MCVEECIHVYVISGVFLSHSPPLFSITASLAGSGA